MPKGYLHTSAVWLSFRNFDWGLPWAQVTFDYPTIHYKKNTNTLYHLYNFTIYFNFHSTYNTQKLKESTPTKTRKNKKSKSTSNLIATPHLIRGRLCRWRPSRAQCCPAVGYCPGGDSSTSCEVDSSSSDVSSEQSGYAPSS